jgi:hypothetical protein
MVDTAQALAIAFAILQAVAFTLFGLATVIFGPMIESLVIVLQAILAAGYDHLIRMIVLSEPRDLFNVLGACIVFVCGVVSLSFAAIKSQLINTGMQGLVGGYMLGDTLMNSLSPIIMKTVGMCEDIGEPSFDFPKGEPTNCQHFLRGLYVRQGPVWAITLLSGSLSTMPKIRPYMGIYSCAITGSSLFMRSLPDVIFYSTQMIDEEMADEILLEINSFQLVATYTMAGLGSLFLVSMKPYMEAEKSGGDIENEEGSGGSKPELNCIQKRIFGNRFLRMILWLAVIIEGRINRMVDKGSGGADKKSDVDVVAID